MQKLIDENGGIFFFTLFVTIYSVHFFYLKFYLKMSPCFEDASKIKHMYYISENMVMYLF